MTEAVNEPSPTRQELTSPEPTRFSPEQKVVLEERGYVIVFLTGTTVGETAKAMPSLVIGVNNMDHDTILESGNLRSRFGDAAIPLHPLQDSGNKTLIGQLELVKELSRTLGREIPGVTAEIGTYADYLAALRQIRLAKGAGTQLFPEPEVGEIRTISGPTLNQRNIEGGTVYFGINSKTSPAARQPNLQVLPLITPQTTAQ